LLYPFQPFGFEVIRHTLFFYYQHSSQLTWEVNTEGLGLTVFTKAQFTLHLGRSFFPPRLKQRNHPLHFNTCLTFIKILDYAMQLISTSDVNDLYLLNIFQIHFWGGLWSERLNLLKRSEFYLFERKPVNGISRVIGVSLLLMVGLLYYTWPENLC
jgi:hypothetical protein